MRSLLQPVPGQEGRENENYRGAKRQWCIFELRDVSAAEMAVALDVPAHPLRHFHPAGLATGTVDAFWRGSVQPAEIGFAAGRESAAASRQRANSR